MHQLLHLLIVDRSRRRAAVQTFGGRWLLPAIACGERVRATVAGTRWLQDRSLPGTVVGQWKGWIGPEGTTVDWLMPALLDTVDVPHGCVWLAIDALRSSRAVLEYERWAIDSVVGAGGAVGVHGPFGTLSWIDEITGWVSNAVRSRCEPVRCFRASPHEVVLEYSCQGRTLYFKGLAQDCAVRAVAEEAAERAAPSAFPVTIARELRPDGSTWRLTTRCAGDPLRRRLDGAQTRRVVADVERLQRSFQGDARLLTALPQLDLDRVRATAAWLRARQGFPADTSYLDSAFEEARAIAPGWAPLDLDPANVFATDRAFQYFDLDAHLAPRPLATAIFRARVGQLEAGDKFRVIAKIVELTMGWERVRRNVDRGELSGYVSTVERRIALRVSAVALSRPPSINDR